MHSRPIELVSGLVPNPKSNPTLIQNMQKQVCKETD